MKSLNVNKTKKIVNVHKTTKNDSFLDNILINFIKIYAKFTDLFCLTTENCNFQHGIYVASLITISAHCDRRYCPSVGC